jgi:hypothetical protein
MEVQECEQCLWELSDLPWREQPGHRYDMRAMTRSFVEPLMARAQVVRHPPPPSKKPGQRSFPRDREGPLPLSE